MRPVELWPEASNFPYNEVLLYYVYEKSVRFRTDMISCHSVFEGDVLRGLTKWRVDADGKNINEIQLKAIAVGLEKNAGPQWLRLTQQPFEELKKTGVRQRCFFFKKLRERLGLNWQPTQAMFDAVKDKAFAPEQYFKVPKDDEKAREYWRKVLDPRVDFYPA